jgi:hypothetical protein
MESLEIVEGAGSFNYYDVQNMPRKVVGSAQGRSVVDERHEHEHEKKFFELENRDDHYRDHVQANLDARKLENKFFSVDSCVACELTTTDTHNTTNLWFPAFPLRSDWLVPQVD